MLVVVAMLGAACASTDVDVPTVRAPAREVLDYLLPPQSGTSLRLDAESETALQNGYAALVRGDEAGARSVAAELLSRDPDLLPARILRAQADFVAGRVDTALQEMLEVSTAAPGAQAAQLLLARSAELAGDPVTALMSYAAVDLDVAARRGEAIREAALQSAYGEITEALARGRVDRAEEWREWLGRWGSDTPLALRAGLAIAEATGDAEGALEALRGLVEQGSDERPVLQRLAELETERGDPQKAIDLYNAMLAGSPGDASLEDGLAAARFRFRMQMLPQGVGEAVLHSEVTRAEFASLLYWLVPGVRGTRSAAGIIVTDVPEEADGRQEIVRVVNLGLMDLANPALRTFEPARPIARVTALASLLRVPGHLGTDLACTAPLQRTTGPSTDRICEVAAACGLIAGETECLPGAPTSGLDAASWLRRTLELLD